MKHSSALSRALRDWRLAEFKLLFLALLVAVLSVTSISFFTDRAERAMRLQGTALLGADLVVTSSRPISAEIDNQVKPFDTARIIEFRSVIVAGDDSLLTEVKAVSAAYPLRGAVETSEHLGKSGTATPSVPAPGEAWAAPDVFYQLGLAPGSAIQLGDSIFTLTRIITFEMDAGGSVFRFAPRLMVNLESLPETRLITKASRATFKLLIAGGEAAMSSLRGKLEALLGPSEALQTIDEGRPEISGTLQRAVRFMKLASVLTVIIAGAAVALAVLSYTRKETHSIAVLKSLGATRRQLWQNYALRFGLLILGASLLGSVLGFAAQFFLARLLSGWMNIALPPAGLKPIAAGLATATLTLVGFALPTMIRALQTLPMRVMRAESEQTPSRIVFSALSIGLAMAGFLVWQAGELKLASIVFAGVLSGLALMLLIAWLITRLFHRFRAYRGLGWQLGLANIGRYGGRASLLITTIGIGILALSLLGSVRQDLISAWQNRVPDNAPNHFLINIQPADLSAVETFLAQRELKNYKLYPMIRGRLNAINGQSVTARDFDNHQAKDTLNRELNLTTTDKLPLVNEIVAGQWFTSASTKNNSTAIAGISVELDIAENLGVSLNDSLGFDIGGQRFEAPITSLRTVQWDTMQPNFYVIAAPGSLNNYPTSYITAVRIRETDTHFTTDLVKAFPDITVLDVRAILKQIRRIIAQASSAVEVVFAFSLLAGIVVLLAAIQTQGNERRQEIAILKTLGASKRQIRRSVATEFVVLGALAGFLGASLALLTGWVLANQVFDLDYQVSWLPVLWGLVAGIVGLGGVGYGVIQRLIRTPPTRLLQEM